MLDVPSLLLHHQIRETESEVSSSLLFSHSFSLSFRLLFHRKFLLTFVIPSDLSLFLCIFSYSDLTAALLSCAQLYSGVIFLSGISKDEQHERREAKMRTQKILDEKRRKGILSNTLFIFLSSSFSFPSSSFITEGLKRSIEAKEDRSPSHLFSCRTPCWSMIDLHFLSSHLLSLKLMYRSLWCIFESHLLRSSIPETQLSHSFRIARNLSDGSKHLMWSISKEPFLYSPSRGTRDSQREKSV